MELNAEKPRRGRPRKTIPEVQLLTELVGVVRDTLAQQQHILRQLTTAQQSQTELLSTWMRLMTPSGTPAVSTTPDQRDAMRAAAEAEWEPMRAPRWDELLGDTFES